MPIIADEPTPVGPPACSFLDVGAFVDLGIVKVEQVQQFDMAGKAEHWPDGNPKKQYRLTGIVVGNHGVTTGPKGEKRPVDVGEVVSVYVGRHKRVYEDAKRAHGPVSVGDVLRWKFDHTEPSTQADPKKVYTARLRKAEAKDGDLVARCEAAYDELVERRVADVPVAAGGGGGSALPDEEPFIDLGFGFDHRNLHREF